MKRLDRAVIWPVLFALAICLFAPATYANAWDRRTVLTVNEPMEVPGAILQPGKYVMKLVDLATSRNIVQITNERENQVVTTAMAHPAYRLKPSDHTVLTFYETPDGQPEALKEWFYPGDLYGQEFVYPAQRAAELSRLASVSVPSTDFTARNTTPNPLSAAQAVPDPARNIQPRDIQQSSGSTTVAQNSLTSAEPAVIAQNTQPVPQETSPSADQPSVIAQNTPAPAPAPAPDPAKDAELPRTASHTLAIAFLGLGAFAGSLALHKLRQRVS